MLLFILFGGVLTFCLVFLFAETDNRTHKERITSLIFQEELYEKEQVQQKTDVKSRFSSSRFFKLITRSIGEEKSDKIEILLERAGWRSENNIEIFRLYRFLCATSLVLLSYVILYHGNLAIQNNVLKLFMLPVSILAGFYLPTLFALNSSQKRQGEIKRGLPDALDLLVICIKGGLSLEPSLTKVALELRADNEIMADELTILNVELTYLGNRQLAYSNFSRRTNTEETQAFSNMMYQSEKMGTPLGVAFSTLAEETRASRMSLAERKAGALSSKLTVPMIVFFVPAMFFVIMGPPILTLLNVK
jgi:tight adherence protein C